MSSLGEIDKAVDRARYLVDQLDEDSVGVAEWKALDALVSVFELLFGGSAGPPMAISEEQYNAMLSAALKAKTEEKAEGVVPVPKAKGTPKTGDPKGGLYL